jgi:hypothetical protein
MSFAPVGVRSLRTFVDLITRTDKNKSQVQIRVLLFDEQVLYPICLGQFTLGFDIEVQVWEIKVGGVVAGSGMYSNLRASYRNSTPRSASFLASCSSKSERYPCLFAIFLFTFSVGERRPSLPVCLKSFAPTSAIVFGGFEFLRRFLYLVGIRSFRSSVFLILLLTDPV